MYETKNLHRKKVKKKRKKSSYSSLSFSRSVSKTSVRLSFINVAFFQENHATSSQKI